MSIEINDSGARIRGAVFQLDENAYAGFRQAVQNNQTRLALEYATQIIAAQKESIENLAARIDDLGSLPVLPGAEPVLEEEVLAEEVTEVKKPLAKKAASRKVGGKKPSNETATDSISESTDDDPVEVSE